MNKLIIIGNGFDLAHGLKTSYNDFILWYLNDVTVKNLSGELYEDMIMRFDNFAPKHNYTEFLSINEFFAFHKRFSAIPLIKDEFFYSLLTNYLRYNWVDIESAYYNRLVGFYKLSEKNDFKNWTAELETIEFFNRTFDFIKAKLFEYLSSFNGGVGANNSAIEKRLDGIINEDPDVVFADKNNGDSVLILNFNYTSTLSTYNEIWRNRQNVKIISIHGNISAGVNSIIFGYGDELDPYYPKLENLNNNELLKNIKSFAYLKTKNYQNFRKFTDYADFKVDILGHSCGLSDRILLNSIFEHPNCKAIKIYYHKRSDTDNDYFEKTQEISRHFKPQNKDVMRRIVVPFDRSESLI